MQITVKRAGEFTVHDTSDHPNQCGQVGRKNYKYRVEIEGPDTKEVYGVDVSNLNKEGFLIDNIVAYDYFQHYYHDKKLKCESCEQMVLNAVKSLRKHCVGHQIEITRILIEIWGSDHTSVIAEWKK